MGDDEDPPGKGGSEESASSEQPDAQPPQSGDKTPEGLKSTDEPSEGPRISQPWKSADQDKRARPTKSRPPGTPGSVKFQDAETTKPRPPTPAELRARRKFEEKQRAFEEARRAAAEKRRKQKRVLMGSAAAVGVVGLVAAFGYWMFSPEHVTAQCVQDDPNGQPVVVPDSYCTGHTAGMNGFFFWGGHQYRYYYGSRGSVGQRPIGGTTARPPGAHITTKSGTTVQRGGFGGGGGKGSSGS